MTKHTIRPDLTALVEILADIEHERWSHWQRYLHGKGTRLDDGSLSIPRDLADKWERQFSTPYAQLTEAEKQSDREQVARYLPAILRFLGIEGEEDAAKE